MTRKYGKIANNKVEDNFNKQIKWRNVDLKDIEKPTMESKLVIIGDIDPPLSLEKLEVLTQDPKFCIEGNIDIEKIIH